MNGVSVARALSLMCGGSYASYRTSIGRHTEILTGPRNDAEPMTFRL
jgi:hypothetical protein